MPKELLEYPVKRKGFVANHFKIIGRGTTSMMARISAWIGGAWSLVLPGDESPQSLSKRYLVIHAQEMSYRLPPINPIQYPWPQSSQLLPEGVSAPLYVGICNCLGLLYMEKVLLFIRIQQNWNIILQQGGSNSRLHLQLG